MTHSFQQFFTVLLKMFFTVAKSSKCNLLMMQNPQRLLLLCSILLLSACIPNQLPTHEQPVPDFLTVSGTIIDIVQNGLDGDVWLLKATDGYGYEVLLSIPNLGETYSQFLKDVDIGTTITVSGDTFKLNRYVRIIARTLELS